jgi:hypothetical protein
MGNLPRDQLHQRFAGDGVPVSIGPSILHLYVPIRDFIADFGFAYADFLICANPRSATSEYAWRRLQAGDRSKRRSSTTFRQAAQRFHRAL